MESVQDICWDIAWGSSLAFVLQIIVDAMPFNTEANTAFENKDFGISKNLYLFSFKRLVAFFIGFGWCGFALYGSILNNSLLILASGFGGLLSSIVIPLVISKNTTTAGFDSYFASHESLNQTAEVLAHIPSYNNGTGQVLLKTKNGIQEHEAISFENKEIPKGSTVVVVGKENSALIVIPL